RVGGAIGPDRDRIHRHVLARAVDHEGQGIGRCRSCHFGHGSRSMTGHRLVQREGGNLVWPADTGTIIDRIGNTPLYPLKRREPMAPGSEIWAKLEHVNPGGSIKDRTAAMMIIDGIARDELRKGKTIIDSTSGNTGVALALIGKSLGYDVTICMSDGVSRDLKRILITFGAE